MSRSIPLGVSDISDIETVREVVQHLTPKARENFFQAYHVGRFKKALTRLGAKCTRTCTNRDGTVLFIVELAPGTYRYKPLCSELPERIA
jgi:hypothetical protein